ncbi:MAG: heavy-metal-associated domain-containing protein [Nocardioidaceae bacterium]
MNTTNYTVGGMTCEHCVRSVTEEVTEIPGVTRVEVDLGSGGLTIISNGPLEESRVRDAVEEAGYRLTA